MLTNYGKMIKKGKGSEKMESENTLLVNILNYLLKHLVKELGAKKVYQLLLKEFEPIELGYIGILKGDQE
jgi:hypothetical protein